MPSVFETSGSIFWISLRKRKRNESEKGSSLIERSEVENVERLKGKQVQFLYDLVTVIREYRFDDLSLMQLHWEGRICMRIFQPGNLPVVWYRDNPKITSNWSYCLRNAVTDADR